MVKKPRELVAVGVCVLLAATSCATGVNGESSEGVSVSSLSQSSDVGQSIGTGGGLGFVGPYAADFRQAYERAVDDGATDIAKILESGNFGEDDFQLVVDDFRQCLAGLGIDEVTVTRSLRGGVAIDGGPSMSAGQHNQAYNTCMQDSGLTYVEFFATVGANPENADVGEIVSTCLVEKGLADSPIRSGDDYGVLNEMINAAVVQDEAGTLECTADPLGILGEEDSW